MKVLLSTLVLFMFAQLLAFAQEAPVVVTTEFEPNWARPRAPVKSDPGPDWISMAPKIEYCDRGAISTVDNKAGQISQKIEYASSVRHVTYASAFLDEAYCAEVRLEFTYPFAPPPPPPPVPLTKQQRREQERTEERTRRTEKKLRKFYARSGSMYAPAPGPRSFLFKGYPATQYFSAPCDYVPCPLRTMVSIQIAPNRFFHITANRMFDQVEAVLNSIDFDALNSAITKWVAAKEASEKIKGPPVSEKPR